MSDLTRSAAWQNLEKHSQDMRQNDLRTLFKQDSKRFDNFSLNAAGLLLDYSKNHLTQQSLDLLTTLLKDLDFDKWREQLFNGTHINHTEDRAALHTALRNRSQEPVYDNGHNVMPDVNAVLDKMRQFSQAVHSGTWQGYSGKAITDIVNIGIGGSDLGPKMIVDSLSCYQQANINSHFISNIDALQIDRLTATLNPETTLFIIASKTFTTQETMTNAHTARTWFLNHCPDQAMIKKHFVAVSTSTEAVADFGIDTNNMFVFWDWVGGRFSLWSAIGLSIVLAVGMEHFESLLSGAHEMDQHFYNAPIQENMPILLGLISVWYNNFFHKEANNHAVLPYDYSLRYLPAYLQQLEMESLGKQTTRTGESVDYKTCPVIWGAPGNNGQHAFYQLLHQGTRQASIDFIIAIQNSTATDNHQAAVLANAVGQGRALMWGRTLAETRELHPDLNDAELQARVFPGNQASSSILYQKLDPKTLGALVALYEHKVFVQSVCWQLNPFDQWGVQLGKSMAADLLPALEESNQGKIDKYDPSTNGLLNYINQYS